MGDDYSILNFFWTMFIVSIWIMWIWVVISIFMDNFRRNDHGGWAKALWTLFIVFLPIIGVLAYMIARPKNTPQDQELMAQFQAQQSRLQGGAAVDDIAKAKELADSGAITKEEFEQIKTKAMATV